MTARTPGPRFIILVFARDLHVYQPESNRAPAISNPHRFVLGFPSTAHAMIQKDCTCTRMAGTDESIDVLKSNKALEISMKNTLIFQRTGQEGQDRPVLEHSV